MQRIIDVEAHYFDAEYAEYLRSRTTAPMEEAAPDGIKVWQDPLSPDVFQYRGEFLEHALLEVAEKRLALMDEAGIDVQLLSLNVPGCEQLEPAEGARVARRANDALARIVARHPDRFAGLAALGMADADASAEEVDRTIGELGFCGVKIQSHVGEHYLDDARFNPIWERISHHDVPVLLHPMIPVSSMIDPYKGYGYALVGPGLGFGHEVAVQVQRLIYSGLFDRLPRLQFVLGHLGEGLFFWMYRMDFDFTKKFLHESHRPTLERLPSDYLRSNFYVSVSGNYLTSAFIATQMEIGSERLLFATDHPYESLTHAMEWTRSLPVSPADLDRILGGNAERIFRLRP
jgi:predicted TIM-barrel fold metal-dependent hydrolase